MKKIVLLTFSSQPSMILAQYLKHQVPLGSIIIEEKISQQIPAILSNKNTIEEKVTLIDSLLKKKARKWFDNYFSPIKPSWPSGIDLYYSKNINSPECFNKLSKIQPDLILIYGTSILKKHVINLPRLGVLNAHASMLPDYRGSCPHFWQMLNNDLNKSGITIHFVDTGVDTGDIIYQEKINIPKDFNNKKTDHELVRVFNLVKMIECYGVVATNVLNGTFTQKKTRSCAYADLQT